MHLEWASVWVAKLYGFPVEHELPSVGGADNVREFAENVPRVGLSMGYENVRISI